MATSVGMLTEDRVVFDCPACGVHHDGPLTIETEVELVEMAVGMFDVRYAPVRKTLSTSACPDVFVIRSSTDEPTYEMTWTSYSDSVTPALLMVVPREVNRDGV